MFNSILIKTKIKMNAEFNINALLSGTGIAPVVSTPESKIQMRINKILSETKTDWLVEKMPLQTISVNGTEPIQLTKVVGAKEDGTGGVRRGHFAIVRSDNKEPFGVVSEQYGIVQNHDVAEVLCGIQDHFNQMNLEVTSKVLEDGRKVAYTLNLPDDVINGQDKTGVVGHTIKRGITLTNSHDGSGSVKFGIYHEVCICSNGMYVSSMGVKKAFRHTGSVLERIKDAVQGFTMMLEEELSMLNNYKRMAEVKMEERHIESIIKGIFNVPKEAYLVSSNDNKGIKLDNNSLTDMSTKSINQVNTFISKALIPEIAQKGGTMWGLMNAVTQYTNHQVKNSSPEYLILGEGRKKNEKAYKTLVKWLNEPRVEAVLN